MRISTNVIIEHSWLNVNMQTHFAAEKKASNLIMVCSTKWVVVHVQGHAFFTVL